jgi:cbb3-type cytochrome oxidase subunit 3
MGPVLLAISDQTAAAVMATAALVVCFIALAIVGWIFWRAAQRDKAAERDRNAGR